MSRRAMLGLAMVAVGLVLMAGLVADPAGALAHMAQTSTESPEAQDVAGDGAFRYRVLAGALFLLSLLLTGLALVYWRATTPPGKRMQRR